MAAVYILFLLLLGWWKPDLMPPLPQAERDDVSRRQLWVRFWKVVVPPIMLVVSVLGSIVGGIAAPTEAASMGAVKWNTASGRMTRMASSMSSGWPRSP